MGQGNGASPRPATCQPPLARLRGRDGRRERRAREHRPQEQIEEVARVAVDVPRRVVRHPAHELARAERHAGHVVDGALGFVVRVEAAAHRRQRPVRPTRYSSNPVFGAVHVQVHAVVHRAASIASPQRPRA